MVNLLLDIQYLYQYLNLYTITFLQIFIKWVKIHVVLNKIFNNKL